MSKFAKMFALASKATNRAATLTRKCEGEGAVSLKFDGFPAQLSADGFVFRGREFPARFLGAPVVDGDETDLRFLDPAGVVVALSAKGTAKSDGSGFEVDADRARTALPLVTS